MSSHCGGEDTLKFVILHGEWFHRSLDRPGKVFDYIAMTMEKIVLLMIAKLPDEGR